jgi:hypothetical protein
MRNLAVRICNVVETADYSRPQCYLNLYKINMNIFTKHVEAPFAMLSPLGGLIVGWPPRGVSQPKKNHYDRHEEQ